MDKEHYKRDVWTWGLIYFRICNDMATKEQYLYIDKAW